MSKEAIRLSITIPRDALERIDAAADAAGENRSAFLTAAALDRIDRESKPLTAKQRRDVLAAVKSALSTHADR